MPPLLTLGLIGAGTIATSALLKRMAIHQPDLIPRIANFDARPLLAGLGLVGTLVFSGPLALLAAAVGGGAVLNMVGPTIQALSNTHTNPYAHPSNPSAPR